MHSASRPPAVSSHVSIGSYIYEWYKLVYTTPDIRVVDIGGTSATVE